MGEPVGHNELRRKLERFLPPVTLLLGPKGTEAWSLADYLLKFHRVHPADTLKVVKLDAKYSAAASVHMLSRSTTGGEKGLLINLDRPPRADQYIHDRNLNRLLVPLEEGNGKIILIASAPTLPTIESRAVTYRLGLLTDEEVQQALIRYGWQVGHDDAMKQEGTTYGRKLLEAESYLKSNVDAVLKAVQERDRNLFNVSMQGWKSTVDGMVALKMLRGWICEALIGTWTRYSDDAAPLLAKDRAKLKAMLVDLDHYQGDSKIIVHAAMDKHFGR